MLFSSPLVALVLSPRLLRIVNTKRQSTVCELTFPARIGALRLNRTRLLVVTDDLIFIYDVSSMKSLHRIVTPSNPYGECPGTAVAIALSGLMLTWSSTMRPLGQLAKQLYCISHAKKRPPTTSRTDPRPTKRPASDRANGRRCHAI